MITLTKENLQEKAPSIFATAPFYKMSEKYRFVPTIDVVEALQDARFFPVYAAQSRTRIEGKGDFTRHVIRFRSEQDLMRTPGEEIPEIVLINSHDGSSAFKAMLGFFRVVCGNGLVVSTGTINEISTRHSGDRSIPQQVIDASFKLVQDMPAVMSAIGVWKQINLSADQQLAYAKSALELRDSSLALEPYQIARPRRWSDDKDTLWNTFNNVQENLTKGGIRGVTSAGRRMRTRAINSVTEDIRLNRALWKLTEEMGKLVTK